MPEHSLTTLLYQHLTMQQDTARFSQAGALHVTDLWDACMRQIYYSQESGIPVSRPVDLATRMHFEMGKAIEDQVRGWLADMNILHEIKPILRADALGLVASPDGRMKNGQLLEIKGQHPHLWKFAQARPAAKHWFQVAAYLWMDHATQDGILFSATWDGPRVPFHEHHIPADPRVGETITQAVSVLRNAQDGGKLPGRACTSETESRALLCPFRAACFRGKNGAVLPTIAAQLTKKA